MPSKQELYEQLVQERKKCRCPECRPLWNQQEIAGGIYDHDHIGSWSLWQGNLDARVVVVGRDWGSVADFQHWEGYPTHGSGISRTNRMLIDLLASAGIAIHECEPGKSGGALFFTNAILCIQPGRRSDPVKQRWANTCSKRFLKPLIDLISPEIVITLSVGAYAGTMAAFGLPRGTFSTAVNKPSGIQLGPHCRLFPMYHPAARPTSRTREQKFADWRKVKAYVGSIQLKI